MCQSDELIKKMMKQFEADLAAGRVPLPPGLFGGAPLPDEDDDGDGDDNEDAAPGETPLPGEELFGTEAQRAVNKKGRAGRSHLRILYARPCLWVPASPHVRARTRAPTHAYMECVRVPV